MRAAFEAVVVFGVAMIASCLTAWLLGKPWNFEWAIVFACCVAAGSLLGDWRRAKQKKNGNVDHLTGKSGKANV